MKYKHRMPFVHVKYVMRTYRVPFDWKNPFGYLIAIAIQIGMMIQPARYIVCMLGIGFASYLFEIELIEKSISSLRTLNYNLKHGRQSNVQIFEFLCKWIRFNSDGKQLSKIPLTQTYASH